MEKLNAKVIFKGNGYFITNNECPNFLRICEFQDEFEANFAYAAWLQYSKTKSKLGINADEFTWILKCLFRLIGVKSLWA